MTVQLTSESLFSQQIQVFSNQMEDVLEKILPPPRTRLHEAMRYSVLGGGKRLRSFFVWASSQIYNVEPTQVFKTAAVVEFIHSYSLVHDDLPCMDNADVRRGKPSCHKVFGESTATLVGDALIPLAFQTLASLEVPSEICLELVQELSRTIGSTGLVAGQMMDLDQEDCPRTYEGLLELQYLKTGMLFGFSMEAGAILGKAPLTERKRLKAYGIFFGRAFQMMDDWLDSHGDGETLGRPAGQDANKFTFLTLLGSDHLYEKVELTMRDAIQELELFGEKAVSLKEAALTIVSRLNKRSS